MDAQKEKILTYMTYAFRVLKPTELIHECYVLSWRSEVTPREADVVRLYFLGLGSAVNDIREELVKLLT
jgi:hypothetical protein